MRAESKVKAAISSQTVLSLMLKVRGYIAALTNNVNFIVTPQTPVCEAEVRTLEQLETQVRNGDRTMVPLRDQKLEEVKNIVRAWVAKVNVQANGDLAILETSGMELARGREPWLMPKKVEKLSIKRIIISGQADLFWKGVKETKSHLPEYRCISDPTKQWMQVGDCFKTNVTITGLTKAKEYEFRVCAANSAG